MDTRTWLWGLDRMVIIRLQNTPLPPGPSDLHILKDLLSAIVDLFIPQGLEAI
jgi:hypothetical protein